MGRQERLDYRIKSWSEKMSQTNPTFREQFYAALAKGRPAFSFYFNWDWLRLVDITDSRTWEYTATSSPSAIAVDYIGGRPVAAMAGNNGADDGHTFQWGTGSADGCIQMTPGKLMGFHVGFRTAHATPATPELLIGFWAAPTVATPIASIGSLTDHALLSKLSGESRFSFKARKASGTAESTTLQEAAMAANTNQDYEVYIMPDPAGAGKGLVEIWRSTAGGPFLPISGTMDNPDRITIASQLPDSVDLTFGIAFEAGDTGTDISYASGGLVAMLR